jgi:hypothetical protein
VHADAFRTELGNVPPLRMSGSARCAMRMKVQQDTSTLAVLSTPRSQIIHSLPSNPERNYSIRCKDINIDG